MTTYAIILFAKVNDQPTLFDVDVEFINAAGGTTTVAQLPYANNVLQAPNLSLGTSIPGTYIIKLSDASKNKDCVLLISHSVKKFTNKNSNFVFVHIDALSKFLTLLAPLKP